MLVAVGEVDQQHQISNQPTDRPTHRPTQIYGRWIRSLSISHKVQVFIDMEDIGRPDQGQSRNGNFPYYCFLSPILAFKVRLLSNLEPIPCFYLFHIGTFCLLRFYVVVSHLDHSILTEVSSSTCGSEQPPADCRAESQNDSRVHSFSGVYIWR